MIASELRFGYFKNATEKAKGSGVEIPRLEHFVADALQAIVRPYRVPIGHSAVTHHPLDDEVRLAVQVNGVVIGVPKNYPREVHSEGRGELGSVQN